MSSSGAPTAQYREWENAARGDAWPIGEPPPWLAASVAAFVPTQHALNVVRPIRALAFGGVLVFLALLAFLLGHSPAGQSALLAASLFGLPTCLIAWYAAARTQRRLSQKKNRIEQQLFGAGLHLEDDGRVLTDQPHPVVIFDTAAGRVTNLR